MLKRVKISNKLAIQAQDLMFELGFDAKKSIFVSDLAIWNANKVFFNNLFIESFAEIIILENPKADGNNLEKIKKAASNCDSIVCLGSGTINDLCKYTSSQINKPYAIFASAASMNGYLSKNASITILGHKKTLPATLPNAVFCDLNILKFSPIELIKAGIGDAMCFYSCWFDWYLSHKILGTEFNIEPFKILEERMDFLINNFQKFSIQNDDFLALLIEILMLSGQGMTIAGGSYPASQSEHLIAHAIEMKYPENSEKHLHGAKIAVSTLTSSKIQKDLLSQDLAPNIKSNQTFDKQEMVEFFGEEIARECEKEFKEKIFSDSKSKEINVSLQDNWKEIRKDLKNISLKEGILEEIFTHFKIQTTAKSIDLKEEEYIQCQSLAKFIRNRFTCLDLI